MILELVWVCQGCSGSDWGPKYVTSLPPGGFSRCRVCTGVDASKIPLPLPAGGFVRFGRILGSSVGPKILDAILLGLLEGTPSSGLPKRLLDSPPGGFMDLEPDSPGWPSAHWNMSAAAPSLSQYLTLSKQRVYLSK